MLGVRAAICRFSVLLLSTACSLERGGISMAPGLCDACASAEGGVLPDAGGDAAIVEPFDAGTDSDGGFDAAAWGWDGATVEPYLCGLSEVTANGAVDLGHAESIRTVKRSATRVLSQDAQHRWILWDVATRRRIVEGVSRMDSALSEASEVDLAGELFTVPVENGVELRRAADGGAFVLIPTSARLSIASGGTYVWSADASGLSVWSPQGASLFSRPGDYAMATIHAAADALSIANGPAGAQVIERVGLDGSAATTPPFAGTFRAFFSDGLHFVAEAGEEAVVYTRDAAEVRRVRVASSTFGGHGRYLWALVNDDNPLCAYSLTPGEAEFCVVGPRRSTLERTVGGVVLRNGERSAFSSDGLDLTGPRPRPIRFALPTSFTEIASDEMGRWAMGDVDGALAIGASLADGALARLGCGRALALAGTAGSLAIASADGQVRVFKLEGERLTLETTLPIASSALAMAADATTIAIGKAPLDAQYYEGDQSLRLFGLAPLALRSYLPQRFDRESGRLFSFSFAPATSQFALLDCSATATAGSCRAEVRARDTLAPLTSVMFETVLRTELPPIRALLGLSPDGSKLAVSYASAYPDRSNMQTFVYRDGQRVASLPGSFVGWANEQTLVVAREREEPGTAQTFLTDLTGRDLAILGMSAFDEVLPIDSEHFYAISENTVYRVSDGGDAWTGPRLGAGRQRGATLGPARVAYTSEHRVTLYTWRDL